MRWSIKAAPRGRLALAAALVRKLQQEPDELLDIGGLPTLQELPGAAISSDRLPIG